ncbi:MAG: response regulator [Polyangiaceae bacterium]
MSETAAPDAKEILVVDDDAGIRRALVEVLRDEGYRVTLAENGHRALQILALRRDDPPSLILLDLMMPVMDGGSFLEAYTTAPSLPLVPVVVLSGNLEIHQRRHDTHVIVYLRKPINLERLLETLELWAR